MIGGGTASNVVPGRCRIEGEARSLDEGRAGQALAAMVDACTWAASELHCDVDLDVREVFRGYRVRKGESIEIAREALARCGHEPREIATGGGSDANALHAAGLDCLLLANGTEANHTSQECVASERIVQMLEVCEAIVETAAGRW